MKATLFATAVLALTTYLLAACAPPPAQTAIEGDSQGDDSAIKEGSAKINLIDGRTVRSKLEVAEIAKQPRGGFVMVLANPVPIDPPIVLKLQQTGSSSPQCEVSLTGVSSVDSERAEAVQYVTVAGAECQLTPGASYVGTWPGGSAKMRIGQDAGRLDRE
ncbi:MAG TPA: hypothetical protein VJN18_23755 [Polyangiaceae bacterium]|nr:hypothetical protein [Polyangiaceae bacterium]